MQNLPGKGKRPVRPGKDEQRLQLYGAWAALVQTVDDFIRQQTGVVFQALRQAVRETVFREAERHALLSGCDEQMYAHYIRLMDTYQNTLSIYEKHKANISTGQVKRILDGICHVLRSRLKQREENALWADGAIPAESSPPPGGSAPSDKDMRKTGDNPIVQEKQRLLQNAAVYIDKNLEALTQSFLLQLRPKGNVLSLAQPLSDENVLPLYQPLLRGRHNDLRPLWMAADNLRQIIENFCLNDCYAIYRDSLKACCAELNDLEKRRVTQYYYDLTENELEVLSAIIKIQVQALEFALEQHTVSALDKNVVHQMLGLLREGYQIFGRAAVETKKVFSDTESVTPPLTYEPIETYTASLQAALVAKITADKSFASPWLQQINERQSVFQAALDRETDGLFEQLRHTFYRALYRLQRHFNEEIMLADEIAAAFKRLRSEWPVIDDNLQAAAPTECEILNGIAETLTIKTESLKENIASFSETGVRMLNAFAACKKEVTAEDSLSAYHWVADKWMEEMFVHNPANRVILPTDFLKTFFEHCTALPMFDAYRLHYEKKEAEYLDKMNKAMFNFKKETLFYEISTYEEILTYSVSRLRAATLGPIKTVVKQMDETMATLETLLKKNSITLIKPTPHDIFNGREHEVLLAEKQPDFKKGEIIKSLNNGYKQKDVVILRANVIAAK